MKKTADLIAKAIKTAPSERELSRQLGLTPTAITTAKQLGRASPALAAALADRVGENVAQWTLAAVIETERSAPLRRRLQSIASAIS